MSGIMGCGLSVKGPNCMNQLMRWFSDDQVFTATKVGAVALGIITYLGTGFLVGYPVAFAVLSVPLAIPLVFLAALELDHLEEAAAAEKIKKARDEEREELNHRYENVKSILHVQGYTYSELPYISSLDFFSRGSSRMSLFSDDPWETKISHGNMRRSIVTGINSCLVPFLALRVKDLKQRSAERVLIAYLGTEGKHSFGIRLSTCEDPLQEFHRLQDDVEGNLQRILTWKHPRFQLA
ncbi:MAG: hypothetical protein Q8L98_02770 [Chlamydiales bacterium]|nr:hypothetical protein [Chlamydiales bacterium]